MKHASKIVLFCSYLCKRWSFPWKHVHDNKWNIVGIHRIIALPETSGFETFRRIDCDWASCRHVVSISYVTSEVCKISVVETRRVVFVLHECFPLDLLTSCLFPQSVHRVDHCHRDCHCPDVNPHHACKVRASRNELEHRVAAPSTPITSGKQSARGG